MDCTLFEKYCISNNIKYKLSEPMREHTTFKIGGNADIFVCVNSVEQLEGVLKELKLLNIPYFILGKGSNLLVSDQGIEGAVITLSDMKQISVSEEYITAMAGATLAAVCVAAAQNSLSGLEFAYGIPGGVGGALFMNAGAYGGEMSQVVISAEYITSSGETGKLDLKDMELGYRTSIFKTSDMIITSVTFKLIKGDSAEIRAKMDDYMGRRSSKQPLEYPSAGSTFKRPEGYFAGALIEKNNLKSYNIGGAMVSEKHAGFVINYNNATCKDVLQLIEHITNVVYEADGVKLEKEVIFIGK